MKFNWSENKFPLNQLSHLYPWSHCPSKLRLAQLLSYQVWSTTHETQQPCVVARVYPSERFPYQGWEKSCLKYDEKNKTKTYFQTSKPPPTSGRPNTEPFRWGRCRSRSWTRSPDWRGTAAWSWSLTVQPTRSRRSGWPDRSCPLSRSSWCSGLAELRLAGNTRRVGWDESYEKSRMGRVGDKSF